MSYEVEVIPGDVVKEIDMTVDANILADGDIAADTQEITEAIRQIGDVAFVQTVQVLDKDDQAGALYVVFLNANQSLGTENSAPNISDANAEKIIAVVAVAAADYVDIGGSQIACVDAGGKQIQAASDTRSIWVALLSADTKTYAGGTMHLKIGFMQG